MNPAVRIYDQPAAQPEPRTLSWFAHRYRDNLQQRVAAGNYHPRRLKGTMAYVDSFMRHTFEEKGAAPIAVGSLPIDQAKQLHLTAWMIANYHKWTKGSTRSDALGAVLGCFNWLEEVGYATSPFKRPSNLKFPRTHHRAMRKQHYQAIMRIARKEAGSLAFRLIFFASWHAGVRLIEFRQLEPHEIDWDASVARIPVNKHKTGHHTGEARAVGLGPKLLRVLRRLCAQRKPGQKYVFVTPRGAAWTKDNLGRHFARYRELAGVPPIFKMCAVRHGMAVRLLADGQTSSKAVADLLGHKSTRMVESIYGAETRYEATLIRDLAAKAEKGKKKKPQPPPRPTAPPPPETPLFDSFEE
jgi:integrase